MSFGSNNPRPCPFCGSIQVGAEPYRGPEMEPKFTDVARCYDCGGEGPPSRSESAAMRVWNERWNPKSRNLRQLAIARHKWKKLGQRDRWIR